MKNKELVDNLDDEQLAGLLRLDVESKVEVIDKETVRKYNAEGDRYVKVKNDNLAELLLNAIRGRYPQICTDDGIAQLRAERRRYQESRK